MALTALSEKKSPAGKSANRPPSELLASSISKNSDWSLRLNSSE